jgi:hypothetical protein
MLMGWVIFAYSLLFSISRAPDVKTRTSASKKRGFTTEDTKEEKGIEKPLSSPL